MKASMILSVALVALMAIGDGLGADPPRRPRPGDFRGPGARAKARAKAQARVKAQLSRIPRKADVPHRVLRPANQPPARALAQDAGPLPEGTPEVRPILRAELSSEIGPHKAGNIYAPEVHYEGGHFRMWYGAQGRDGHDRILLAVSEDGEKWTRRGVVVSNDEANHVNDPSVVRVGGTYYMFYTLAVVEVQDVIAMATSQDGVHWNKQGTVLGPGAAGEWDSLLVGRPSVMYENNMFRMWYDGRKDLPLEAPGNVPKSATSTRLAGYASSPDGVHWTKHSHPVFDHGAGAVDVKKINGVYVMAYESMEGTMVAVSKDGIYEWTPKGLWVPVSGRDFDRYGHVTPMIFLGPRGRVDSIFLGTTFAESWDRNMIARARLSQAQLDQVAGPPAPASNP